MKRIRSAALGPARFIYYRWIRHRSPRRIGTFNSVAVRHKPFGERSGNRPHEEPLCQGIKAVVQPGDTVCVVGAGAGVSAVHASVMAGQHGRVVAFEATKSRVETAETTLAHNLTPSEVELIHAVIGDVATHSVEKYGGADGDRVSVGQLPSCDVLVSDCEGAERHILDNLCQRPRAMVIESHGFAGASAEWVCEKLASLGYTTEVIGTELEAEDVRIVKAIRE